MPKSTLATRLRGMGFVRFTEEEERQWREHCRGAKTPLTHGSFVYVKGDEPEMKTVAQDQDGHHWVLRLKRNISGHGFTCLLKPEEEPDALTFVLHPRKRKRKAA